MIQLDDAMSIVINTYLYTPTEYHKHLARLNLAGENKRRDWQECAREEIPADESFRASAQRWLANKKILNSSLSTSTDKGWRTLIARCSRCAACSKAWCFRQLPPSSLLVEHAGECKGPLNLEKVKQFNAQEFAQKFTPGRALVEMQDILVEQRPSINQLKNRRPLKKGRGDKPPPGIDLLRELSVVSDETVSILFTIPPPNMAKNMLQHLQFRILKWPFWSSLRLGAPSWLMLFDAV